MGVREIFIIIASLIVPAVALGGVFMAARLVKRDLTRLPRRWLAPGVTGFMMVGAVTTLILLNGTGPAAAHASPEVSTPETAEPSTASTMWVRVYPLENWGEENRRYTTGEEVARVITKTLRDAGFFVKKGLETDSPVGLYESTTDRPVNLIDHYRKIAPFICVTGYVSTMKDGRIEVTATLSHIDATARSSTIVEKKQKSPRSPATIAQMARQMAEEMIDALDETAERR